VKTLHTTTVAPPATLTPGYARTHESNVGVLFAHSGITGVWLIVVILWAVLVPVSVPGWWVGDWRAWVYAPTLACIKWVVAGGLVIGFVLWALLVYDDHRALRGEAVIPEPGAPPVKVQLEVTERTDGGQRVLYVDLPVSRDKLALFCRAVLAGRSMAEGGWTGAGNPFSLAEYRGLRDAFLDREWIKWLNPAAHGQGLELTPSGRAVFVKLAE
jgi:hypothetical protein